MRRWRPPCGVPRTGAGQLVNELAVVIDEQAEMTLFENAVIEISGREQILTQLRQSRTTLLFRASISSLRWLDEPTILAEGMARYPLDPKGWADRTRLVAERVPRRRALACARVHKRASRKRGWPTRPRKSTRTPGALKLGSSSPRNPRIVRYRRGADVRPPWGAPPHARAIAGYSPRCIRQRGPRGARNVWLGFPFLSSSPAHQ